MTHPTLTDAIAGWHAPLDSSDAIDQFGGESTGVDLGGNTRDGLWYDVSDSAYFDIGTVAELRIQPPFTLSFWVRNITGVARVLYVGPATSSSAVPDVWYSGWGVLVTPTAVQFNYGKNINRGSTSRKSVTWGATLDSEHHVLLSINSATSYTVFVDGVALGSPSLSGSADAIGYDATKKATLLATNDGNDVIVASTSGSQIADILYWGRLLTTEERSDLASQIGVVYGSPVPAARKRRRQPAGIPQ